MFTGHRWSRGKSEVKSREQSVGGVAVSSTSDGASANGGRPHSSIDWKPWPFLSWIWPPSTARDGPCPPHCAPQSIVQ